MDKYEKWMIKKSGGSKKGAEKLVLGMAEFLSNDDELNAKKKNISLKEAKKRRSFISKCWEKI